jgi:hypothetical protein
MAKIVLMFITPLLKDGFVGDTHPSFFSIYEPAI